MTAYDNVSDFGLLYDALPAYEERTDVGFYVDEAKGERSVLEIGCGTGRVLLPIARSGVIITGLDSSPSMLTRCGDRVEVEPLEVRKRISLAERDVRNFALPDKFTLAIAPFRILQHLTTIEDQLRCLANVRRHLEPGGRFIFDVFNPLFHLLVKDRTIEAEETPEVQLPDGRFMRRNYRIPRVRFVEQVSEVELIYYVRTGDSTDRVVQAFEMRWYQRAELAHLLARAGFIVEAVYGGFDKRPLADDAPEIVVVARNP